MKHQIQTWPLESWSRNDHWVRKSKYVKQKGVKKVHTTMVDEDQMQVEAGGLRAKNCQSSGNIKLAASTKMVQMKYVFKTVKGKWNGVCYLS